MSEQTTELTSVDLQKAVEQMGVILEEISDVFQPGDPDESWHLMHQLKQRYNAASQFVAKLEPGTYSFRAIQELFFNGYLTYPESYAAALIEKIDGSDVGYPDADLRSQLAELEAAEKVICQCESMKVKLDFA